ncbi:methyltransferase domain-containing protein [Terrimonas sp. NA20]|uniref:Methyltransferase domain-containing protein n=1 Tax=Terrimonas ginsenosidimutans TaxID=2908004 RepID=A0ABS9KWR9_9BACT|nr:methyltransferase domain-containing protein [Terrimonas ginsenosidimutans]MCG2616738.1 methyltransferase domain-containing protein [Terrimonas ginsenosidimutans]
MPWNPDVYNQFKQIRYRPFFDLMSLIVDKEMKKAVDIGCGTGEQTSILSGKFEQTDFLGLDSSAEMLAESRQFVKPNLHFESSTIEKFALSDSKWDLIFSNAALQWSDDHEVLFPGLISKLNPGGQFAVQMPFQQENVLNEILLRLVQEDPFAGMLDGFVRRSPLLKVDDYARILFSGGLNDLDISLKVYPIIAEDEAELYSFIAGSALVPYMEKLDETGKQLLREEFKKRIKAYFKTFPAVYAFKRILLYGVRP